MVTTPSSPAQPGFGFGVTIASRATPLKPIPADVIADISKIGFSWVRLQVLWDHIELSPGVYDPSALDVIDNCVSLCNKAGLHVQFPIQTPPAWHLQQNITLGQGPKGPWHPWDPQAAAKFASDLATRYNGVTVNSKYGGPLFIDVFEYNENFDNEYILGSPTTVVGQLARDPKWFIPVQQACYPAIKAASPKALVGMCALWWELSEHRISFMEALYASSCPFDYANMHFYSGKTPPGTDTSATRKSLGGQIAEIVAVMDKHGDTTKPVAVTEFGWQVPTDVPESTRITYYQQAYDIMLKSGRVNIANCFTLSDTDPLKNAGVVEFSLTHSTTTPRYTPTYTAVQTYVANHQGTTVTPTPSPVPTPPVPPVVSPPPHPHVPPTHVPPTKPGPHQPPHQGGPNNPKGEKSGSGTPANKAGSGSGGKGKNT